MSSKNYALLVFKKYLSFSEVQKSCKVVRKKSVCSKSVTKTLYRNKFLVSECISNWFVIARVAGYQRLVVCNRNR